MDNYILNMILKDLTNKFISIEEIYDCIISIENIDNSIIDIYNLINNLRLLDKDIEASSIIIYVKNISLIDSNNIIMSHFKEAYTNCIIGVLYACKYKNRMDTYEKFDKGYKYFKYLLE